MMELLDKEKPDVIVNFAAQSEVGPSWENPAQWFQTRVSLARSSQERREVVSKDDIINNKYGDR